MAPQDIEVIVSFIIVNWNTREILLECLESLERYGTKYKMEVIVVDNGSADGSQLAVRRRFPKVILIENGENLGFSKANNIGMRQAAGRYLCLMNSDVKVLEGCIDRLVRHMDTNPGIGMIGPKILNPDLTLQDSCRRFPSLWTNLVTALGLDKLFPKSSIFYGEHMIFFLHDRLCDVDYIAGAFMFVRRDVLDLVGPLDERFFIYREEVDWCKRMKDAGWRITFFPGAEVVHHHAMSSSKDPIRFSVEQLKAVLQYWHKHFGTLRRIEIHAILIFHYGVRYLSNRLLFLWPPFRRGKTSFRLQRDIACLRILFR